MTNAEKHDLIRDFLIGRGWNMREWPNREVTSFKHPKHPQRQLHLARPDAPDFERAASIMLHNIVDLEFREKDEDEIVCEWALAQMDEEMKQTTAPAAKIDSRDIAHEDVTYDPATRRFSLIEGSPSWDRCMAKKENAR